MKKSKHWDYRVLVREVNGSREYSIHEVYFKDGTPEAYAENPVKVVGDSTDDLQWQLDMMTLSLSSEKYWHGDRFPEICDDYE